MPILSVPHVKQNGETHCGVACLEMVYRYFGIKNITQNDIWKKKKTKRPDGTDYFMKTGDMVNDLTEHGFRALSGQLYLDIDKCARSIQALIEAKIPFIACKQSDQDPTYGHFVVIIGIENEEISYLDPNKDAGIQTKKLQDFITEWQYTGEEVSGGQFIIMWKDNKKIPFKNLYLTSFKCPDLESFRLETIDF